MKTVLDTLDRRGWKSLSDSNGLEIQTGEIVALRSLCDGEDLWGIVDACNEPDVPLVMLNELGPEKAVSLYRGHAELEQAAIAPYLAKVELALFDWIVEKFLSKPWGFFMLAESDLESLRSHLRKFLTVKTPDGGKMYFRYYDPRILLPWLRASNDEEVEQFLPTGFRAFLISDTNVPDAFHVLRRAL